VKDRLEHGHPHPSNPIAIFIYGRGKRIGRTILTTSLAAIYAEYKEKFFPRLLENPHIPTEDKAKIKGLLKKPWNPYVRRHSVNRKINFAEGTRFKTTCRLVCEVSNAPEIYPLLWQ
jgi:hypothetical protein